MKHLLLILALTVGALTARAQTTTNISVRFTTEVLTNGVLQTSTNVNLNLQYSAKKDATRIDGLNFAYSSYTNALGIETVALNFPTWLRQNYQDFIKSYADQKQRADAQVLLDKLTLLLTSNIDLLSNADLTSLNSIAAKAP